jgi:hypothetical protein
VTLIPSIAFVFAVIGGRLGFSTLGLGGATGFGAVGDVTGLAALCGITGACVGAALGETGVAGLTGACAIPAEGAPAVSTNFEPQARQKTADMVF